LPAMSRGWEVPASPKANRPPSAATSSSLASDVAAIPTTGRVSGWRHRTMEGGSPKAKMPPSEAAFQYPWPVGVDDMATIGELR